MIFFNIKLTTFTAIRMETELFGLFGAIRLRQAQATLTEIVEVYPAKKVSVSN